MRGVSSVLAVVGMVVSLPGAASAQQMTPFIARIAGIAQPCYGGKGDPVGLAETCVKALASINAARTQQAQVTPHEQNMYLANSTFVTTALSRLYTDIDKGRTARVCVSVELSWKSVAAINDAASPDYAPRLKAMRESLVPAVTKCREEMGVPPGAPPLPATAAGPPTGKPPAARAPASKPRP